VRPGRWPGNLDQWSRHDPRRVSGLRCRSAPWPSPSVSSGAGTARLLGLRRQAQARSTRSPTPSCRRPATGASAGQPAPAASWSGAHRGRGRALDAAASAQFPAGEVLAAASDYLPTSLEPRPLLPRRRQERFRPAPRASTGITRRHPWRRGGASSDVTKVPLVRPLKMRLVSTSPRAEEPLRTGIADGRTPTAWKEGRPRSTPSRPS